MRDERRKIYDDSPMNAGKPQKMSLIRSFCLSVALALGLNACAPADNTGHLHHDRQGAILKSDDGFAYGMAQATVREGLKNITKRYIDPIDMDVLAVSGMQGLATIDPRLHVGFDQKAHEVELFLGDKPLKRFSAPTQPDPTAWAFLTTKVIRSARAHSSDMKNSEGERVFEAVFDGMMSNLDIFSRYAGGEEARSHRAQRDGFGGIGVRFKKSENGLLITHIHRKSPAQKAGLKTNDLIVQIEGGLISSRSKRSALKLLHGPVGSLVALTVERQPLKQGQDTRRIDFNLRRSHIVPETVESEVNGDVLTLRITSFNKNTSTSVHSALKAHNDGLTDGSLKGVTLDLRGNPGGLLSQSVNVADLFLKKGRIISTRGRHSDSVHDYTAGGVDLAHDLPLIILVDGNSASAAEIVASALGDLGRAVVIGSASYGKGTVQTVVRLPNDGEMTLTWSRLISPSGYALHGLGVMPAICATNTHQGQSESISDAILAPRHIFDQRKAMSRWWSAGLVFDGQRPALRTACPSKVFKAKQTDDLLIQLAERVIADNDLYQRTILKPDVVATAHRH